MCRASQDPDAQGGPEYEYEQHLAQMERDEQDHDGADDYQERQGEGMREMQMEDAEQGPQVVRVERNIFRRRQVNGRYTYRAEAIISGVRHQQSGMATLEEARATVAHWRTGPPPAAPEDASTKAASFIGRAWASLWKAGKP